MIPNNEEIQKERYEQYLAEERKIFDSLLSNDVEFNRTMRYFSGGFLVLMTAYIDWNGVNNVIRFSTYTPFILSILSNIIAYVYVRKSLQKQSEFNEDYYINNIEAARFYESKSGKRGNRLIRLSIISFIVGMLIFLAFLGFGVLKIN